jgi:hypothetical protein
MKEHMKNDEAVVPLPLGEPLITEKAKGALKPQEVLAALWKHAHTPWGRYFDPANEESGALVEEERRLVSNHSSSSGALFKIATEGENTVVFLSVENDLSTAGSVDAWVLNLACPSCG